MKGFGPLLGWVVVFLIFIVAPFVLMGIKPEFKYILMLIIGLGIYNFVRMFFGDSFVTLGVTGVLFYLLVWKHFWETTLLWWLNLLIGLGVFSFLGWTYIAVTSIFRRR